MLNFDFEVYFFVSNNHKFCQLLPFLSDWTLKYNAGQARAMFQSLLWSDVEMYDYDVNKKKIYIFNRIYSHIYIYKYSHIYFYVSGWGAVPGNSPHIYLICFLWWPCSSDVSVYVGKEKMVVVRRLSRKLMGKEGWPEFLNIVFIHFNIIISFNNYLFNIYILHLFYVFLCLPFPL
jgi:hypothetical protein